MYKYTTQLQRETEQSNLGRLSFEKMINDGIEKQRESTAIYGVKLVKEVYETLNPQILYYFENQQKAKRKAPLWLEVIEPLVIQTSPTETANLLSFMFAQTVLNKISGRSYMTNVVTKFLDNVVKSSDIEIEEYSARLVASTYQLIRHFVDSVSWLVLETEPRYREGGVWKGGKSYIIATEEKLKEIEAFLAMLLPYQVYHKPMIVKPKRHTNLLSPRGGFIKHRSPLLKRPVKLNGSVHPLVRDFNDSTNPEYFNMINSLQEVGYRINTKVLKVIPELVKAGVIVDGLDYDEDLLSIQMEKEANSEINEKNNLRIDKFGKEAYLLGKREVNEIKQSYQDKVKQAINSFNRTIDLAQELAFEEELYFPVYNDNRGRIYYYGKGLNPQGNVLQKSLLELTDSNRVTDVVYKELLEGLGTCLGYGKKTLEKRLQLALEAIPTIVNGSAVDIVKIMDEEEALVGLSIALEIKAYLEAKEKGEDYFTHQIIHMDACNSANQLTGLLLKDKRNAKLTNILNVEGDTLEDSYQVVADNLHTRMKENNETGIYSIYLAHPEIFNRKVFKKSTMTRSAYDASVRTCDDDIRNQLRNNHPEFWKVATEAQKKVFVKEAVIEIDSTLPASSEYKKFARTFIREALKRDEVLAYTNPRSGFPVVLRENVEIIESVNYRELYTGKYKTFTFKTYTDELNIRGSVSSSVPSVIHSFDGAAIVRTKQLAGNIAMSTIHDSIGVLAGNVHSHLVPSIQQTYYEICKEEDLKTVIDELNLKLEVPFIGDLNPEDILKSKHMYS